MISRKIVVSLLTATLLISCTSPQSENPSFEKIDRETRSLLKQQLISGNGLGPNEKWDQKLTTTEEVCRDFRAQLPKDWIQDFVVVPEDLKEPFGRQIKVFYYGKVSQGPESDKANSLPVVFFNGGPGGTSHSSYKRISETQARWKEWRSLEFVFIDQRGNGCSDPYPQGSSPEVIETLSHYGSREIVADAEAVRKKLLGSSRVWRAFGQSYGAYIVHRYLMDAPQGLHSAHAHANVLNADPKERFTNRIASQGRVLERYFQQYSEDREILKKILEVLTPEKCYEDEEQKEIHCGAGLLVPLIYFLGFQNNWEKLHSWLHVIWDEEGFNDAFMRHFAEMYSFSSGENTDLMHAVLSHVDRNGGATCNEVFENLKSKGLSISNIMIHECLRETQFPEESFSVEIEEHIKNLPTNHMLIENFKEALIQNSRIPFYLYSGDLDTFVPEENFHQPMEILRELVIYKAFRGTGHEGFYTEPLVWKNLLKN